MDIQTTLTTKNDNVPRPQGWESWHTFRLHFVFFFHCFSAKWRTSFSLLPFSAHGDISVFWLMSTSYEVSRRGFWSINKWGQQRGAFDWNLFSTSADLFCCSVFMFRVSVSTSLSFSSSSQRSLKQREFAKCSYRNKWVWRLFLIYKKKIRRSVDFAN